MTAQQVNWTTTINPDSNTLINAGMEAVERAMYRILNSDVDVLRDASQHILDAGGKRIRPRLTMLSYIGLGGTDIEYAAPAAAAVELMHTASVVHDDINDHGVVRRGRPSVNAKWGRTFALLTGDFLFTAVYQLMAPYGDLNVDLAEAATALVEGETLQASAVKNNHFTREIYSQIIALKTAALFRAGTTIGGKLANATPSQVEAMGQYGFNVGLAFQIIDDILDIIGDEATLGKTAGIDVDQGRGYTSAYSSESSTDDIANSIKRKMLQGNAIDEARQKAQQLIGLAISYLDVLPHSIARDALVETAYQVINRDR